MVSGWVTAREGVNCNSQYAHGLSYPYKNNIISVKEILEVKGMRRMFGGGNVGGVWCACITGLRLG